MTVAIIGVMTHEQQIEKLNEKRQKVITINRLCFWSPIIIAGLSSLGVLPPMLLFIAYPIGLVVWSLHIGDRERLESAINDLKKRSDRKL
jgi:hypothetical protein